MSNLRKQVAKLSNSTPIGDITPIGNNGYGRDDAGRIFSYMSVEQKEALRRQRKKAEAVGSDRRHFSFTHMLNIKELTDGLSNKYCGYILKLQPCIQFRTGLLVEGGKEDGKPLTRKAIAKLLKVSPRTVNTVIEELTLYSIIFEESNGSFSINDSYHFRKKAGANAEVVIKTFFTTLNKLNLKPAELGFLYKLLPYVHYNTNIICADPFQEIPSNVRFLNEKQIGELLGMSESKTKEMLSKLRKAGAIGEFIRHEQDQREKLTVMNPYIFYRKNGKPDNTLAALFSSGAWDK